MWHVRATTARFSVQDHQMSTSWTVLATGTVVPDRCISLLELAAAELGALTLPESTWLASMARAIAATAAPVQQPTVGSAVRSELVTWLCTDSTSLSRLSPLEIRIESIRLTGQLNLAGIRLECPLAIRRCTIPDGINLTGASFRSLDLSGSATSHVEADDLTIAASLTLARHFTASEGVKLNRARIGGDFNADSAQLRAALDANGLRGDALKLNSARVDGSVKLTSRFRSDGSVSAVGATIGGDFDCAGARITRGSGDYALLAENIHIGLRLLLHEGFTSTAMLRLGDATIAGDVYLQNAEFTGPDNAGYLIHADGAKIGGSVWCDHKTRFSGIVRFRCATIGADCAFGGATFDGRTNTGMDIGAGRVTGTLSWKQVHNTQKTQLVLKHACIGLFDDDASSWPDAGNLYLDGSTYTLTGECLSDYKERLAWIARQPAKPFRAQPYQHLYGLLRSSGLDGGARRVAIEAEEARGRNAGFSFLKRVGRTIMKHSIGYGYATWRSFCWLLALMTIGALVFAEGNQLGLMVPSHLTQEAEQQFQTNHTLPPHYPPFNPIVYSVETALPVIRYDQESNWAPYPARACVIATGVPQCGRLLEYYLWIHITCGWVLATLAIAGLTGIARRD